MNAAITPAEPTRSAGEPPRRSAVKPWLIWTVAGVLALVLGLGGGWLGARLGAPAGGGFSVRAGAEGSCDAVAVASRVLPAIVTINVTGSSSGVGSGEIVRKDGYIVTNDHVISAGAGEGGRIVVTFSNGEQHPATIVGRDIASDISVLKIDASGLPVIATADSDAVAVGQPVVALGAPLGLSSTVTAGIVSALGRTSMVPADAEHPALIIGGIQTDAAINPGNSGGALVDCRGRMIGVNTAIATVPNAEGTAGGGSVGIGFAVPSNRAMSIANDLIEHGTVQHPDFGLVTTPIPAAVAQALGGTAGLYVNQVTEGGAAARAGLQPGDVITRINGSPAIQPDALYMFARTARTGDTVQITYLRDGTTATASVTL